MSDVIRADSKKEPPAPLLLVGDPETETQKTEVQVTHGNNVTGRTTRLQIHTKLIRRTN